MPNLTRTIPKTIDAILAQRRAASEMASQLRQCLDKADDAAERERLLRHIESLERIAG